MELLKVKNLNFEYVNKQPILKNISFKVDEGEFIAIVGENGSRKKYINKMYSWTKSRI